MLGCLLVVLACSVVGIALLITEPHQTEVTIRFTPDMVSLEAVPQEFRVTISNVPDPYKPEDINSTTVTVEGIVFMKQMPNWPKITKNFFAFKVDGSELLNFVILQKIGHMAPQPGTKVNVPITVTGQYTDGTDFQGTFDLVVLTEHA